MSDPKVNSASSSPVPGVAPGNPGVTIDAAMPTPDAPESKKSDSFGRDQLPEEKSSVRDDGTTRRSGESPFAELARRAVPIPMRTLAAARGIDAPIDLPFEVLEKAAALETELGPERVEVFAKVREGAMLVATDAQLTEARAMALDTDGARSLAQTVIDKGAGFSAEDARMGVEIQKAHFHGIDINAFVQYVLRESYLIQSELLYDYAQKVKHYNELKKLTRERLEEMREIHSAWAERDNLLGTDVIYHDANGVPYMVLGDNGEWFQDKMSEQDVKNWIADVEKEGGGSATGGPQIWSIPVELQNAFQRLYGVSDEPKLQAEDEIFLGKMLEQGKGAIKDNIEHICELLPKMTQHDLEQYVKKFLRKLNGGNTAESEILEIYEALPAPHCLWLIGQGMEEEYFDFGRSDADAFIETARAAAGEVAAALGCSVTSLETPESKAAEAWEIKGPEARNMLNALGNAIGQNEQASRMLEQDAGGNSSGGGPAIGDPKVIDTAEGMDNYISSLEEQLNSIGDDAQLANVDLQNALQKQQQTLQMMSNISKVLHDTAMAIIRKIGS